jgi:hypothetical protein
LQDGNRTLATRCAIGYSSSVACSDLWAQSMICDLAGWVLLTCILHSWRQPPALASRLYISDVPPLQLTIHQEQTAPSLRQGSIQSLLQLPTIG